MKKLNHLIAKSVLFMLACFSIQQNSMHAHINVPKEMYTLGTLDPTKNPPVIDNSDIPWTFVNETGCDFKLNMMFHLNGDISIPYFYNDKISLPASTEPDKAGVVIITNTEVYNYFGFTETGTMSHLIFQLVYNGDTFKLPLGPNEFNRVFIPGCGMVCWYPNLQTKTFRLIKC